MFYPRFWLNATGYFNNPPEFGPGVLMFQPSPEVSMNNSLNISISMMLFIICTTLGFGIWIGKLYFTKLNGRVLNNREYMSIEMI